MEREQEIVVAKTVFGYWERSARRHQKQFAAAERAPEIPTGKGQMFSNTLFLEIAVRNDNQNMCANLIPQRKTQNATSSQKIRSASVDSRSKQRSSSTTRGMRGRSSIPNSRRPVERSETKRPGGETGVNICTATQVQQKNAPSLPAAKRQEDKRWVRILRQEGWNLYLLMRQGAEPNRKKPGNTTGYLAQSGLRFEV